MTAGTIRKASRQYPTIDCHPGDSGATIRIAAVDTETTGLDVDRHELIEVHVQCVDVSTTTGRVVSIGGHYGDRESPTRPLSAEARRVLGTTDEALAGRRFDDAALAASLAGVDIVVAHRASFDRPFLERRFPLFERVDWCCSIEDVDWCGYGASSASLDAIATFLGWSLEDGSPLRDSQLIVSMLSVALDLDGRTGFADIIGAASPPGFRIRLPKDMELPCPLPPGLGAEYDASAGTILLGSRSREALMAAARSLTRALPELTLDDLHVDCVDARTRFSRRAGVRIPLTD